MRRYIAVILLCTMLYIGYHYSEAHFFGPTKTIGKYQAVFQPFPINPTPGQNVTLGFSLLDSNAYNVFNVAISAEIKEGANTIYAFPEKIYEFSDASLVYNFPREGIYKIIYHANVAGDDTPVVADFDVFIGNSSTDADWLIISIGIASITGIIFWLKRKKSKDQKIKEDIT